MLWPYLKEGKGRKKGWEASLWKQRLARQILAASVQRSQMLITTLLQRVEVRYEPLPRHSQCTVVSHSVEMLRGRAMVLTHTMFGLSGPYQDQLAG